MFLHLLVSRTMRVEWRWEACRWEKKNLSARTWSACVRECRLAMTRATIRRLCTARRAGDGSAMPTPRMRSGIRACCALEKRAARHRASVRRHQPISGQCSAQVMTRVFLPTFQKGSVSARPSGISKPWRVTRDLSQRVVCHYKPTRTGPFGRAGI